MEDTNGIRFLATPPLSILVDQELVERSETNRDGERKKDAHTTQELFAITCSVNNDGLTIYPIDIKVRLDTPSSGKDRLMVQHGCCSLMCS